MNRYGNRHGSSGVVAYATTAAGIIVRFANCELYEYTDKKPGRAKVDRMKTLAAAGRGLSTFISQHVRDNYARKL